MFVQSRAPLLGVPHAERFYSKGAYGPFHSLLVAWTVEMSSRRSPRHCCCQRRACNVFMYCDTLRYFGWRAGWILRNFGWRSLSLPLLSPGQSLSVRDLAVLHCFLSCKKITAFSTALQDRGTSGTQQCCFLPRQQKEDPPPALPNGWCWVAASALGGWAETHPGHSASSRSELCPKQWHRAGCKVSTDHTAEA